MHEISGKIQALKLSMRVRLRRYCTVPKLLPHSQKAEEVDAKMSAHRGSV